MSDVEVEREVLAGEAVAQHNVLQPTRAEERASDYLFYNKN